ncbi:DMT family transporter [candidate division WOR-3 bacterium]|nr:DMT family transporter [candidate division WOR-3 bacterium]
MTDKTKGVLVVLGASVMWAIEPVVVKLSYQTTDVSSTFATRALFCLLTILAYLLIKRIDLRIEKRYLPKLIYVSLVGTLFADLMYIYALSKIPVINAVLIGHMQPIFIVVMGYLVLKTDRITRFDYLGIFFMIVAGLLVTSRDLQNLLRLRIGTVGDLYVLLATIAWATTAIVARKYLQGLDAAIIAFYRFLFGTAVFVAYLTATSTIEVTNVYQIILGVVIGTGTILYYEGIRRIKAAQVGALELSTPFFAAMLGYAVLRESLTPLQLCGMLSLLGGIYFLSRKE